MEEKPQQGGTSEVSDCQGLVFENLSLLRGWGCPGGFFYLLNLESDLKSVFDQKNSVSFSKCKINRWFYLAFPWDSLGAGNERF